MSHNVSPQQKAVLFDLDGTLVDTLPDLISAANDMLRDLGYPARSDAEVRSFVGNGIVKLVHRCIGESADIAEKQRAEARFAHYYEQVNGRCSQLYPGVVEMLQALRAQQRPLALVTNKSFIYAQKLAEALDIAKFFGIVVGGDSLATRKPQPEMLWHACEQLGVPATQALMVGDSLPDAEAAKAAGMPVVLVSYGYTDPSLLAKAHAAGIVSRIADLKPYLA